MSVRTSFPTHGDYENDATHFMLTQTTAKCSPQSRCVSEILHTMQEDVTAVGSVCMFRNILAAILRSKLHPTLYLAYFLNEFPDRIIFEVYVFSPKNGNKKPTINTFDTTAAKKPTINS